ncbi:MAG: cytochrome c biogenesis protein ResB [Desulfamplus sp.]|nr:cytochrome c biogenesis protein ResB [Desulfamplus sp.]
MEKTIMAKNGLKNRSGNPVWIFFTSVKLTVIVLLLLAVTSIIGTLVPQNGTQAFYVHKYGEFFFRLFDVFDIFDMYSSWWFVMLLVLLSVNIVVCSIDKLDSTWKIIFPDKVLFNVERFRRLKNTEMFVSNRNLESLESMCRQLIEKNFSMAVSEETDQVVAIFGERGRWTRIGVYVVHLSILLMLAGAVIGSVWGFKAFVAIPEGTTVDSAFLRGNDAPVELGFELRCNAFSVSFYDTGHPEEFKSSLTVIEDGKESFTRDIVVNDPLRYKGLSFYQSSYGVDSAKSAVFKITSRDSGMTYSVKMAIGETIDIPESGGKFTLDEFVRGYNFRGHNLGEGFVGRLSGNNDSDKSGLDTAHGSMGTQHGEADHSEADHSEADHDHNEAGHSEADHQKAAGRSMNSNETELYIPVKFPTFDKMRRGAFAFEIQDYEKKYYTGLQVAKDPGVLYVYAGFVLMIIGCWITFFMSHQSICVEIRKKIAADADSGKSDDADGGYDILISGTANKNSQGMKLKIAKIASRMRDI